MHCGMTPGVVDARAHNSAWQESIQGSAKRQAPGLVNLVPAVAYHICLSLPAALSQPGRSLLANPCILLPRRCGPSTSVLVCTALPAKNKEYV